MATEFNKKRDIWLISVTLVVLTLVAYEPIRHNDFVNYDDDKYVTKNPNVTGGITWPGIKWAFTKTYASNWHPLTWLSHMADCEIYGLNPVGHHITNVVIHIINSLLLFLLLSKMTGSVWGSGFVAAIFAVHPVHVESVAWAAERKDVLSGLFWMLTILAYVHYAERPSFKRYVLVVLAFVMGLLSKPMVVTLPFILLLLDWWPLECIALSGNGGASATQKRQKTDGGHPKATLRQLVLEKVPLIVLSVISSVMAIIAQRSGGAVATFENISLDYRIANALTSYINYIGKMIWPSGLAVFYPHPHIKLSDGTAVICGLLLVLITLLSIYTGRRRKHIAMGWLWYIVTLVPVIGLAQIGTQAMANRYMYIPMAGLLIIVAWEVKDIIADKRGLQIAACVSAVIVIFSAAIATRTQVKHWENSLTLFDYTLKVTENNLLAENNYGSALFEAGRVDEAIPHLKNMIRINPRFSDARIKLGKILMGQKKVNEAIVCFNEVLEQNEGSAEAHYNLAFALEMQNKYDEAIKHLSKALAIDPDYTDARNRMGISLMATGRIAEAIGCFERILGKKEDFAEAHYNLAVALGMQNKYDEAIKHLSRVLDIEPNFPDARNKLGVALMASGRTNEAIGCFTKLLEQNGESAEAHYNLAEAFRMQKKYDEALRHLAKALETEPNYPEAHNRMGIILLAAGRPGEAVTYFNEALRTAKDKGEVYASIGMAYTQLGKNKEAIQNLSKVVELKPNNVLVLNNLGWAMAAEEDVSAEDANRAIEYAKRACELTGYKDARTLDTLAVAYAAAGRFEEAVKTAEKATDTAKAGGREDLVDEIQKRMELYKAGQRYYQK